MSYTIYTDGGCAVNPGGPGGCGIVIINDKTKEEKTYSYGYRSTTNNRMEMLAVYHALEHLPKNPGKIVLHSDSQYVLKTLQGEWQKKKNLDLWKLLDEQLKDKDIKYHWVKGHNNNKYNEMCDQLATEGINSSKKLDDPGYGKPENALPEKPVKIAGKAQNGSAMSATINVPAAYKKHADISVRTDVYAGKMQVSNACAEAIIDFYRNGRISFQAYASLKTGGRDAWSAKTENELLHEFGQEVWDCANTVLKDKKDTQSAIRWYGRGLALNDAIRKVMVDREIQANAKGFKK